MTKITIFHREGEVLADDVKNGILQIPDPYCAGDDTAFVVRWSDDGNPTTVTSSQPDKTWGTRVPRETFEHNIPLDREFIVHIDD